MVSKEPARGARSSRPSGVCRNLLTQYCLLYIPWYVYWAPSKVFHGLRFPNNTVSLVRIPCAATVNTQKASAVRASHASRSPSTKPHAGAIDARRDREGDDCRTTTTAFHRGVGNGKNRMDAAVKSSLTVTAQKAEHPTHSRAPTEGSLTEQTEAISGP
jgi:hypothetical protein